MVGCAWAYALAAGGQPGVDRILALLREDIDRSLRLLGCASLADLDRSLLQLLAAPGRLAVDPAPLGQERGTIALHQSPPRRLSAVLVSITGLPL
jgi:hypothetical protein